MAQFRIQRDSYRLLGDRIQAGDKLSAEWLNRIRDVLSEVARLPYHLSTKSLNIGNHTDTNIPPFSVLEILDVTDPSLTVLSCARPSRCGLSRVVFTRSYIPANSPGFAYEGGIQVARCQNAVLGKYAQTKKNRFWLQFCETGPFRVLAILQNVPWLTLHDNYVLVDCAGEKDTDIVITQNSANPRNIRVLDFVGFTTTDNGDGTLTIS